MWTIVEKHDSEGIARFVEIMQAMDRNYEKLTVASVRSQMCRHGSSIYHYANAQLDLVIYFMPSVRWNRHYIWSLGFLGGCPVSRAHEVAVDGITIYLEAIGISELYAIRPKRMRSDSIQAFHDGVPEHPAVKVELIEDSGDSVLWRLRRQPWIGDLATTTAEAMTIK